MYYNCETPQPKANPAKNPAAPNIDKCTPPIMPETIQSERLNPPYYLFHLI